MSLNTKGGTRVPKQLKTLDYLNSRPYKIWWKVVAGNPELSILQEYDLIFDDYDLKIRKLSY